VGDIYKKIDLRYNNAHRLMPDWCYMTDIDAVEVRGTTPVALIEYKQMGKFNKVIFEMKETNKLTWQLQVYKKIATALNIPVYFIGYSNENVPNEYIVWNINANKFKKFNLEEFQQFLKQL